jgi:DNA processing protein
VDKETKKQYQVALSLVSGVGASIAKNLISYCGSAQNVFEASSSQLRKIPNVGNKLVDALSGEKSRLLKEAERQLIEADKYDTKILLYTDKDYPQRLKNLPDSPYLIYHRGGTDLNTKKVVAIVGTRKATQYGKDMTQSLIAEMKQYNPLIVSGLAYGIDIEAHRASIKNDLPTIAVMASGMDTIYPSVHRETAKKMLSKGGLITEESFGTKPDAFRFPARNRIIAGMADVVVVVEAAEKGGALITARIANSYDKEVFAVPGRVNSAVSKGCNNLIKSHQASLLTGIKDFEYILNWSMKERKKMPQISLFENDFDEETKTIINFLKGKESVFIDDIVLKTQMPSSQVASCLLSLEFKGFVKSMPGKMFCLIN